MKFAVSSVSMPSLAPADLLARLVEAGYTGVEWRVAESVASAERPWHAFTNNRCTIAPDREAMRALRRDCEAAGVSIVSLSPYLQIGDVAQAQRHIELAAEATAHRLRLWSPRSDAGDCTASRDRMLHFIDALLPSARRHGVQLALETHQATITPSASLAMQIAGRFDPALVRVIYDIGNLALEGYEHPSITLPLMGAHLGHVQIKNARPAPGEPGQGWTWDWCPMELGVLPLQRIVRQLAATGFDDWLSVEDFSTEHTDTDKLIRNRALLADWLQG